MDRTASSTGREKLLSQSPQSLQTPEMSLAEVVAIQGTLLPQWKSAVVPFSRPALSSEDLTQHC